MHACSPQVGQDTAWVNLCWNQLRLLGIELTTPLLMGILSLSPAVVSFHLERTFVYMPRSTLALSMYVGVVAQTPERWGSGAPTWLRVAMPLSDSRAASTGLQPFEAAVDIGVRSRAVLDLSQPARFGVQCARPTRGSWATWACSSPRR